MGREIKRQRVACMKWSMRKSDGGRSRRLDPKAISGKVVGKRVGVKIVV